MKTSTKQTRNCRPAISKIVMALAVASVMGGMAITPALADNNHSDNNQRQVHRDNGWHNGEWRGNRDHRRGYVQTYYYQQPYYSQPYYAQPVYVPPPVYYAPQPSLGVSLFFPLHIRR